MRIKPFNSEIVRLGALCLLLNGCLWSEVREKDLDCERYNDFSSTARKCLAAEVQGNRPPVGNDLGMITFIEDSGRQSIPLNYFDPDGDTITKCVASSIAKGLVKEKLIYGIKFKSKNNDLSGHRIAVNFIDNGSTATTVTTLTNSNNDRVINIHYRSTPSIASLATIHSSIVTNPTAASWVNTTLTIGATHAPITPVGPVFLDNIECVCHGGICSVIVEPVANWSGNTNFSYVVEDGSATSRIIRVPVTITPVNDRPNITDGLISATEDGTYRANLITDRIIDAHDSSGIETVVGDLTFIPLTANSVSIEIIDTGRPGILSSGSAYTINIAPYTITNDVKAMVEQHPILSQLIKVVNNRDNGQVTTTSRMAMRRWHSLASDDSDPHGATLSFELISGSSHGPHYGTMTLSGDGNLIYTPNPDHNSDLPGATNDSFTFRVRDASGLHSPQRTVSIRVNPAADIPRTVISTMANMTINEDDIGIPLSFGWTHPDRDRNASPTACSINDPSNSLYAASPCTISGAGNPAGNANIVVNLLPNVSGNNMTINYTVSDSTGTSNIQRINFNITEVDDIPYAGYTANGTGLRIVESPTFLATPLNFTLDSQAHPDTGVTQSYRLVTPPTNGTLSNCLGLGSSNNQDLSCTYLPNDGNVAGAGARAEIPLVSNKDLVARAHVAGTLGNNIRIQMIPTNGFTLTANNALAYTEYDATGPLVKIIYRPGTTTNANILDAVVNSSYFAGRTIEMINNGGNALYIGTPGTYTMAGGIDPVDQFTYSITEINDDGDVVNVTVPIEIEPVNDPPVICEYTPFSSTNTICGQQGCIGSRTPVTEVPSPPDGLYYYNQTNGTCWRSGGGSWMPTTNHIGDKRYNELHPFILDKIKINEGGGNAEANQSIRIMSINSSNGILLNNANISIFYNGTELTGPFPITLPDGTNRADLQDLRIDLDPTDGQTGTTTITMVAEDSQTPPASTTISFDVTIDDNAAQHGGWVNLKAVGPKINKFDQHKDAVSNVCSYSRTSCSSSTRGNIPCKGTSSPSAAQISPRTSGLIYYDSSNDACYRVADNATAPYTPNDWEKFSTTCNITPSSMDPVCGTLGASCMGNGPPTFTPSRLNTAYYDIGNNICYRSIETDGGNDDWQRYKATAAVTLIWNQFRSFGSSVISGYNVYRRLANTDFNYNDPINRELIPVSSRVRYVDDAANSFYAPIPGTVYYYEVRPVINGIPTNTNEIFKTIRMIAPPKNMAFVHRWMVNKSTCKTMHSNQIDPSNNYRCPYEGPGDTGLPAGSNFYDLGKDMLVHRFEAGCPYDDNCDTPDGQCIGVADPDSVVTGNALSVYYSRSSGKCFVNTSTTVRGTSWDQLNARCDFHPTACAGRPCVGLGAPTATTPVGTKYLDLIGNTCHYSNGGGTWSNYTCQFDRAACNISNDCVGAADPGGTVNARIGALYYNSANNQCWQNTSGGTTWANVTATQAKPYTVLQGDVTHAELPPLTFVDQEHSASICSLSVMGRILGFTNTTMIQGKLPSRKEQVAFSWWDTDNLSTSTINSMEMGLSLNSSSKCNTTSANGLEDRYSDVDVPDSNNFFSLPGTQSSDIRSMATGSSEYNEGTGNCTSRYGVQDHVGNVMEWSSDRIICDRFECRGVMTGDPLALSRGTADFVPGIGSDSWDMWRLDGLFGPCVSSLGVCDSFFTPWALRQKRFSATRFSIPLGLPIDTDSNTSTLTPVDLSNSAVAPYFVNIGPSNGISSNLLHNDVVDIKNQAIESEPRRCGGIAGGGDYTDGNGAGTWNMTVLPCTNRGDKSMVTWESESSKIGFRCVFDVNPTGIYLE